MSDTPPPSNDPPELELGRPPGAAPPAGSRAPRSAARPNPLPPAPRDTSPSRERLQESASDVLLNAVAILREVAEDFRARDRFFKFKALALALWFATTVGAFGVACPSQGPTNDLDARLVISGDEAEPIYMVKNDGDEAWQDVELVVNGTYRSTVTTIEQRGGSFTLSSGVLFDAAGHRAPSPLRITDIRVQARQPDAAVVLLKGGVPQDAAR